MAERDKQRMMKPHLWLIKVVGVIIRHRLRADWRQEGVWWLDLMGRLKPGATFEQARDSLNGAFQAAALEAMAAGRRIDRRDVFCLAHGG